MKQKLSAHPTGALWALLHFLVETACFFWLFSRVKADPLWWSFALLYDALAFLPQGAFGMLCDRFPRLPMGALGGLMVLAALWIPWHWVSLPLLALGNALMHVEGARATLCGAKGKMGPSGLFVGGGSIGVIVGQLLAGAACPVWIPGAGMVLAVLLMLCIPTHKRDAVAPGFDVAAPISTGALVLLTVLSVMARAYVAYAIPTSWNKELWQTVLLFVTMGIGKAAGGYLADWLGARFTAFASLTLALPLLIFGDRWMVVSLLGVALFSMTMPLSLGILVSRFPRAPGLAFGMTTFGLFVGTLPAFFLRPEQPAAYISIICLFTLGALLAFALCLKKKT